MYVPFLSNWDFECIVEWDLRSFRIQAKGLTIRAGGAAFYERGGAFRVLSWSIFADSHQWLGKGALERVRLNVSQMEHAFRTI
jgi:hypothetical protein